MNRWENPRGVVRRTRASHGGWSQKANIAHSAQSPLFLRGPAAGPGLSWSRACPRLWVLGSRPHGGGSEPPVRTARRQKETRPRRAVISGSSHTRGKLLPHGQSHQRRSCKLIFTRKMFASQRPPRSPIPRTVLMRGRRGPDQTRDLLQGKKEAPHQAERLRPQCHGKE